MGMKKYRRIVRPLGKGREAVRCVDGRWRVFEFARVVLDGEAARRWVCVYVEAEVGKWPQAYFDQQKAPMVKAA